MRLNKRIRRSTLTKPHICKIQGVWEVFPACFKSDVKGSNQWFKKAEQYAQRMNCREMFNRSNKNED